MLRHTLRLAWKVLLRRKSFTVVRVLIVAVTLCLLNLSAGVYEVLFGAHPLRPDPQQVLELDLERAGPNAPARNRQTFTTTLHALPGVAAWTLFAPHGQLRVPLDDGTEWRTVQLTDPAFFAVVPHQLVAGRGFAAQTPCAPEVVITDVIARALFGREGVVGKTLQLSHADARVVGVVREIQPQGFPPFDGTVFVNVNCAGGEGQGPLTWRALLRIPPGGNGQAVAQQVHTRLRGLGFTDRDLKQVGPRPVDTLRALAFSGKFGLGLELAIVLMTLLAALGIMILPATSLANVALAGLLERQREIGVRRAFGASARQIVLQLLIENLVLTALGAVLAALVPLTVGVFFPNANFWFPGINHIDLRLSFYLVAAALTLTTMSGLLPALRLARLQPLVALRGAGR